MVYPNAHLYLTLHWTQSGATTEVGQTGVRFDSTAPATQALVSACAPACSTFWQNAVALIDNGFTLQFLRLASIGADGNYVPGTLSYDHIYSPVPAGGGGGPSTRYPLQVAWAATLNTAMPRGRAHNGRMYFPWPNTTMGTDFRFSSTDANNRSNALAAMLSSLNTVLPGDATIFSKVGAGTKNLVTSVKHGRRPDVQRRRASALPETYGTNWNVTT